MSIQKWGAALLCLSLSFEAVAAKPEVPAMPIAQELPVELRLVQQELEVDIADTGTAVSAGMGGGLLGALVGAAVNKQMVANGEKRVAELRTLLVNYHFNERFEGEIRRNFGAGISPNPQFKVEHTAFAANDTAQGGPVTGVLVITPKYTMSQNFETMKVAATVTYVDRYLDKKNRLRERLRFTRSYAWNYDIPSITGNAATADAERWSKLGADKLAAMIDNGIVQTVALINYDFSETGRADPKGENLAAAINGGKVFGSNVYTAEQVTVQRATIRAYSGWLGRVSTEVTLPASPMTAAVAPTAEAAPATPSTEAAAPAASAAPATPAAAPVTGTSGQ